MDEKQEIDKYTKTAIFVTHIFFIFDYYYYLLPYILIFTGQLWMCLK